MLPEHVQQKLDALPASPGVYLFKDRAGGVLYVGKAGSLRSRVRSYFQAGNSDDRFFISYLERELGDLETFVVGNEKEAALLENELIKQHQPRYNVKLRDDKDFLSIRIQPEDAWPRLSVVRRPKPDGARYYGPYDSATSARQTLRQINRFFKLRTCRDTDFRARVRPCLQYQIKRCPAPCVLEVDRDSYGAQVDLAGLFLEGKHDQLVDDLERRMRDAADAQDYEQAAVYRDQLRSVERVRTTQRIATVKAVDQDVIGFVRAGDQVEVALLEVRASTLLLTLDMIAILALLRAVHAARVGQRQLPPPQPPQPPQQQPPQPQPPQQAPKLIHKVEKLKEVLQLDSGLGLRDAVETANKDMGLASEGPLPAQVKKLLSALGIDELSLEVSVL